MKHQSVSPNPKQNMTLSEQEPGISPIVIFPLLLTEDWCWGFHWSEDTPLHKHVKMHHFVEFIT